MVNGFDNYKNTFAERLVEQLEGKSVLRFSKTIGIPTRTLNSWIQKETAPRMEYLIILAQSFNCSIDYLVGLEDEFGNKIKSGECTIGKTAN